MFGTVPDIVPRRALASVRDERCGSHMFGSDLCGEPISLTRARVGTQDLAASPFRSSRAGTSA
jgi:hypothetical protein